MNSYIFEDRDGEVHVEYFVDAISPDFGKFQVYQTRGVSDAEIRAGIQFRELPYGKDEFVEFADTYDLRLTFRDSRTQEDTVVRDWGDFSFSISLTDSYL